MSDTTTTSAETGVRTFRIEVPEREIEELRRRIDATRWPTKELVADRSQGVQLDGDTGTRPLLDDRLRLAKVRGAPERAAAVQDQARRARHPLHPCGVETRERVAVDHDARLAGLDHRAARDHRPTHRPDRARRPRRGRVPPRAAVHPRLRLLRRADRARLGAHPHRPGVGAADAAPRLHALRRAGRRRGLPGHGRDGPPGTRRV